MIKDVEERRREMRERSEKVPFAEPAKPAPIKANGKAQPKAEVLVLASTLNPENHEWLWNGWLARTELHLIAGTPGVGKTTLALRMAATVSSGADWPDGTRCEPGNVLIWSGEDQPQKTILPRLLAMNADRGASCSSTRRTRPREASKYASSIRQPICRNCSRPSSRSCKAMSP